MSRSAFTNLFFFPADESMQNGSEGLLPHLADLIAPLTPSHYSTRQMIEYMGGTIFYVYYELVGSCGLTCQSITATFVIVYIRSTTWATKIVESDPSNTFT